MVHSVYGKSQQRTGMMINNAPENHGLRYRTLLIKTLQRISAIACPTILVTNFKENIVLQRVAANMTRFCFGLRTIFIKSPAKLTHFRQILVYVCIFVILLNLPPYPMPK